MLQAFHTSCSLQGLRLHQSCPHFASPLRVGSLCTQAQEHICFTQLFTRHKYAKLERKEEDAPPLHTHGLSQARRRCGLNMRTYERDEIGYTEWRTLLDARFSGLESKVWCLHITVESGAEGWAKQMPLFGCSLQYVPTAASLRDPN